MESENIFNIKCMGTIKSVTDMIVHLTSINKGPHLFYRGESKNYQTKLMPTIYRGFIQDESIYYYDAVTNFPQEFENLATLSRLAKMQHYGYPTRLLDLTSNPLVALYFACRDNKEDSNNNPGYFYIFKTKEVLNCDSDRALLLTCLSHLNYDQQENLANFLTEFIDSEDYDKYSGRITKKYIDEKITDKATANCYRDGTFQFERLIGEAVRERVAFLKYNTRAEDLFKSYIVKPLIQNERQKKQDGLFLIMGLLGKRKFYKDETKNMEIMSFKVEEKEKILRELDSIAINHATLFCDLEGRAKYLKERNRLDK